MKDDLRFFPAAVASMMAKASPEVRSLVRKALDLHPEQMTMDSPMFDAAQALYFAPPSEHWVSEMEKEFTGKSRAEQVLSCELMLCVYREMPYVVPNAGGMMRWCRGRLEALGVRVPE